MRHFVCSAASDTSGTRRRLSTQEIVSLGHALHALAIYDQRAFKPVRRRREARRRKAAGYRRSPRRFALALSGRSLLFPSVTGGGYLGKEGETP